MAQSPTSPTYPGAPRWVKILGIISVALAAAFVAVHLAGGGFGNHAHFGGPAPSGAHDSHKAHE